MIDDMAAVAVEIEVCGLKVEITVTGPCNVLTADDRELAVFGIIRQTWCAKRRRHTGPADTELDEVARKVADTSPVDRLLREREAWLRTRKSAEPVLECHDCGGVYEVSNGGALLLGRHTMEAHDRAALRAERTPKIPEPTA